MVERKGMDEKWKERKEKGSEWNERKKNRKNDIERKERNWKGRKWKRREEKKLNELYEKRGNGRKGWTGGKDQGRGMKEEKDRRGYRMEGKEKNRSERQVRQGYVRKMKRKE